MKAKLPAPMATLHNRIDQVRKLTPDFPQQLSEISAELPISATRLQLQRLSRALANGTTAASLSAMFPRLRWLLTIPASSASTDILSVMLHQSSYESALHRRRIGKTAYPIILLMIAFCVLFFICVFLVPIFAEMFADFGLQLGKPTLMLIGLSDWITSNLVAAIFIATAICGFTATMLWLWISDGPLKRFVLGYDRKAASVRFSIAAAADQLAELAEDQVELTDALRITAESNTEPTLRRAFADLATTASEGSEALQHARSARYLPPNIVFALQNGPDDTGGVNTRLLRVVAANHRDLSIHRRDWTSFLLGPAALIGIGVMILFVITALFSPFFSLISALSG